MKSVNMRSCKGRSLLVFDADKIKNIVLDERQRELMFEGKRWYDLMRMDTSLRQSGECDVHFA